ncbi:MAG: cobalamin biosynthesis protein [Phormidium tanganyikae FI6-MK23]|nr:cobalamin biosynthesis protein [Phormidium tanganyikae FI6-MK23]
MRTLWIGIGCRRGTSKEVVEHAIAQVLEQYKLAETAIVGIATVDRKSDETGLLEYCEDRRLPLSLFSVEQLQAIAVPNPSINRIGTPSVAEAAAICAAGSGVLRVPKQVIKKTVTIAIAQISPCDKLRNVDLAAGHEAIRDRSIDFDV